MNLTAAAATAAAAIDTRPDTGTALASGSSVEGSGDAAPTACVWDVSGTFYVPGTPRPVPEDIHATPDPVISDLFAEDSAHLPAPVAESDPELQRKLRLVLRIQSWARGWKARRLLAEGRQMYEQYLLGETRRLEELQCTAAAMKIQAAMRGAHLRMVFGRLLHDAGAHTVSWIKAHPPRSNTTVGISAPPPAVETAPVEAVPTTAKPSVAPKPKTADDRVSSQQVSLTQEMRRQRAQERVWLAANKRTWAILRKPI